MSLSAATVFATGLWAAITAGALVVAGSASATASSLLAGDLKATASGPAGATTAAGTTASGPAGATAGASPSGGHGSPPGTRGSPRRSEMVAVDPLAVAVVAGIRTAAAVVGTAAAAVVGADGAERTASGVGMPAEAGDAGTPSTEIETLPAGGQGSPPGTRGRPRRSCRVAVLPAFTAGA